jgi:hypothetical protein
MQAASEIRGLLVSLFDEAAYGHLPSKPLGPGRETALGIQNPCWSAMGRDDEVFHGALVELVGERYERLA